MKTDGYDETTDDTNLQVREIVQLNRHSRPIQRKDLDALCGLDYATVVPIPVTTTSVISWSP